MRISRVYFSRFVFASFSERARFLLRKWQASAARIDWLCAHHDGASRVHLVVEEVGDCAVGRRGARLALDGHAVEVLARPARQAVVAHDVVVEVGDGALAEAEGQVLARVEVQQAAAVLRLQVERCDVLALALLLRDRERTVALPATFT